MSLELVLWALFAVEVVSLINNWMVVNRNYRTSDRNIKNLELEVNNLKNHLNVAQRDLRIYKANKIDPAGFIVAAGGVHPLPKGWHEQYAKDIGDKL